MFLTKFDGIVPTIMALMDGIKPNYKTIISRMGIQIIPIGNGVDNTL
jgi:hypothetical protein